MNHLLFILAVNIVVFAQAASFDWKNSLGGSSTKIFQSDGETGVAEGTIAYLFCTTDKSQADLLKAVRGGDKLESYAISGANGIVNSNSKIPVTPTTPEGEEPKSFEYGSVGNDYSFYYALINGDEMLISTAEKMQGQQGAIGHITFTDSGGDSGWSKNNFGEAAFSDETGAGWYSISGAVPEPFSGSLILLGLGAIALRKRRG